MSDKDLFTTGPGEGSSICNFPYSQRKFFCIKNIQEYSKYLKMCFHFLRFKPQSSLSKLLKTVHYLNFFNHCKHPKDL